MTRPINPNAAPRFEIVDERYMPKRRSTRTSPWLIVATLSALRNVIEDGYVSLAKGAMHRAEQLEDAQAGRGYAKRVRKAARQKRRQARKTGSAAS